MMCLDLEDRLLVLAMQSITTMMPVRQCGHWRNDCPVSAS